MKKFKEKIKTNKNVSISYAYSETGEVLIRKRKRKRNFMDNKLKKLLISGIILLSVLIITFLVMWLIGFFNFRAQAPENLGNVVYYNGHKYVFNENIISSLFIGYDQSEKDEEEGKAGQSDFVYLMALDLQNHMTKAISIPRDTMVDIEQYYDEEYYGTNNKMQIALSYAYGDGREKSSELTKKAVSRLLFNMPINKYISLNMEGVGSISAAIGGVKLFPLESIPKTNIIKDKRINLSDSNATAYVRWRSSDMYGSENRRKRDVQFMEEFYKSAFKAFIKNLSSMVDLFIQGQKYSVTNIGIPELIFMAVNSYNFDINKIETKTIAGNTQMGEKFVEFWPDETNIFETILDVYYICVD